MSCKGSRQVDCNLLSISAPMLKNRAKWAPSAACCMSASGQTTTGELPPSSRVTGLMCSAAPCMILMPTLVEPVKATCSSTAQPVGGRYVLGYL